MTGEDLHMEHVIHKIEKNVHDCDTEIATRILAAGRLNATYFCNNEITDVQRHDFLYSLEKLGRQFEKNCSCKKV